MRAFNLREAQTYTVKALTTTTDELGGQIETWAGTATIQAEVQPLSGSQVRNEMGITDSQHTKPLPLTISRATLA